MKLEEFEPREVRRILVNHCEKRYEIQGSNIYVLRIWHTANETTDWQAIIPILKITHVSA